MNFTRKGLVLVGLCLSLMQAWATHYRAGEILYEVIGTLTYRVTVVTYTKISPPSNLADRDSVDIDWGDGTVTVAYRVNGPPDGTGIPSGVVVLPDVKKNEYVGVHTYAGVPPKLPHQLTGFYVISFTDPNRLGGIANMAQGNSINVQFCLQDTLFFFDESVIGPTSSPVLENSAVQYANLCDTFVTNPEAVDSDGDSLIYELADPLQDPGVNVPEFIYPDAYCRGLGVGCNINEVCQIDRFTGQFIWADPCLAGFYNVDILIHIYRHSICVGTMQRDMQIIVITEHNNPPRLMIPNDTCIRAGDMLRAQACAWDSTRLDTLLISADGDPFHVLTSPAVFDSITGFSILCQTFQWNTVCGDIQAAPYNVYFRAEDSYREIGPDGLPDPYHLQDIQTWRITVIPPPVLNLAATVHHHTVTLTWQNPYICGGDSNFRYFTVWRKTGCDSSIPAYCQTGLEGTGYVQIAIVDRNTYTYVDNTIVPGQEYSYRILADFYKLPPNGDSLLEYQFQESVPSNGVCVIAPVDVPVLLNVSVTQTSAASGKMYIRWYKPLAGGINLDTIQDPPPYRFDLYRSSGFNYADPGTGPLASFPFSTYAAIPDTQIYNDSQLNTLGGPYSYDVYLFGNNNGGVLDTIGASTPASSVYLTIQPSDQALNVHWQYNVPWSNDSFIVYRQNHITDIFDSIAVSYGLVYRDTGLINDTTYCYYVKSIGRYASNLFPDTLINNSEILCDAPIDTVPPCPPTLTVTNDCGQHTGQPWDITQYVNHLIWNDNLDTCAYDVIHYHIYYNATDSNNFTLLDSLTARTDTTYDHILNDNLAGCYAVTAVDKSGHESKFSNIVCIDNCPYYVLPNAFTPNGDNHNDVFHPFLPYRFVPKIEMKIYNRWGELVFETTDPDINWKGTDLNNKPVSEGVYIYAGYYYEQHINGLVRKPLSGEKKGGGFIQLIRGKP